MISEKDLQIQQAIEMLVDAIYDGVNIDKVIIRRAIMSGFHAICEWERYSDTSEKVRELSQYMKKFEHD